MAFHQPTRQALQRAVRPPVEERDVLAIQPSQQQDQQELDQSQTWVLFSPVTDGTNTSDYSETVPSIQTPGRSRISDLGSLQTAPRSDHHVESGLAGTASPLGEEDELVEDDAELDSLDSHLPSFRSLPGISTHSQNVAPNATPVLPGHDGLGSFQFDHPTSGLDAQNQIYQFERFNPRRTRRRRESIEHAQSAVEVGQSREDDKREWIEAWRLEHSRILMDEVQKETRRKRRAQASLRQSKSMPVTAHGSKLPEEVASDNMTCASWCPLPFHFH